MQKRSKKKAVGRPKGSTADVTADAVFQFRLLRTQKAKYTAAAKSAGISLAEWVKLACDEKADS